MQNPHKHAIVSVASGHFGMGLRGDSTNRLLRHPTIRRWQCQCISMQHLLQPDPSHTALLSHTEHALLHPGFVRMQFQLLQSECGRVQLRMHSPIVQPLSILFFRVSTQHDVRNVLGQWQLCHRSESLHRSKLQLHRWVDTIRLQYTMLWCWIHARWHNMLVLHG